MRLNLEEDNKGEVRVIGFNSERDIDNKGEDDWGKVRGIIPITM